MAAVAALVRRCAWCARVFTEQGREHTGFAPDDSETATIRPYCVDTLRAREFSR